jgi:hypothetical protein
LDDPHAGLRTRSTGFDAGHRSAKHRCRSAPGTTSSISTLPGGSYARNTRSRTRERLRARIRSRVNSFLLMPMSSRSSATIHGWEKSTCIFHAWDLTGDQPTGACDISVATGFGPPFVLRSAVFSDANRPIGCQRRAAPPARCRNRKPSAAVSIGLPDRLSFRTLAHAMVLDDRG